MDNEYSTRLIFLESLTIDSFMKMRLDKMAVIRMESRQRKRITQTLVLRKKEIILDY